jgi:sugar O-acyltransferase (sialic acid O-acetyltransferase NeuD family)
MSDAANGARVRVLVIGAGGQGRIVADILLAGRGRSHLEAVGFADDRRELTGSVVSGLPVLGTLEQVAALPHDAVVVAIGDNAAREQVTRQLEAAGERLVTARHHFSSVAADVEIDDGCMISAGVVITPGAHLGRGVLVNTNASIDHDTAIGDFAHVAPGAVVGATVQIGARALIGTGATVMTGCAVGDDAVVGAGALVNRDVAAGVVVVGVPARVLRRH